MEKKRTFYNYFLLCAGIVFFNMWAGIAQCSNNPQDMLNANPEEIHATIDQDYARVTKEKWEVIWGRVFKVLVAYKIADPEHVALSDFKTAWQGKNGWFFVRVLGSALVALREIAGLVQDGYELYQLQSVKREIERAIDLELAMRRRHAAGLTDSQKARDVTFEDECNDAGLTSEAAKSE